MSGQSWSQILVYAVVLLALAYPLGLWMARVYGTFRAPGPLRVLEDGFYRVVGTEPRVEQNWKSYGQTVLVFSALFTALLYGLQSLQGDLCLNPERVQWQPTN